MTKSTKKNRESAIQKIPQYKMNVINRLLESDVITKLLKYDTDDALFKPSLSDEEKSALVYDKIYPYRFMPDAIEQEGTWITLGASGFRRLEEGYDIYDDYHSGDIYFYFFTHYNLMKTDSGVRQDLILAELDKIFDGERGLGMGELKLRGVYELWMHNNKFGGYTLAFTLVDLK